MPETFLRFTMRIFPDSQLSSLNSATQSNETSKKKKMKMKSDPSDQSRIGWPIEDQIIKKKN